MDQEYKSTGSASPHEMMSLVIETDLCAKEWDDGPFF